MINTEKGRAFYDEVSKHAPELMNIVRDYKERLEYKPSLVEPFERHKLNSVFKEEYLRGGYVVAIRKTLGGLVRKAKFKRIVDLPMNMARKFWRMARRIVKK